MGGQEKREAGQLDPLSLYSFYGQTVFFLKVSLSWIGYKFTCFKEWNNIKGMHWHALINLLIYVTSVTLDKYKQGETICILISSYFWNKRPHTISKGLHLLRKHLLWHISNKQQSWKIFNSCKTNHMPIVYIL